MASWMCFFGLCVVWCSFKMSMISSELKLPIMVYEPILKPNRSKAKDCERLQRNQWKPTDASGDVLVSETAQRSCRSLWGQLLGRLPGGFFGYEWICWMDFAAFSLVSLGAWLICCDTVSLKTVGWYSSCVIWRCLAKSVWHSPIYGDFQWVFTSLEPVQSADHLSRLPAFNLRSQRVLLT